MRWWRWIRATARSARWSAASTSARASSTTSPRPGASRARAFKPFIYSAALEKGFTPATVVNDAPLFFDAADTGSQPWEPKNYDGKFEGPMPLHTALAKSKNMVSIRVLQATGVAVRAGLAAALRLRSRQAPGLPDRWRWAPARSRRCRWSRPTACSPTAATCVPPVLIQRVTDNKGRVLLEHKPPLLDESMRTLPARNAFVMSTLLQEVTRSGTGGARAGHAEAARPLRQDRHHQRLDGRLVRRLPAHAGGGGVDRLRQPAQAGRPRNRRRPGAAGVDRVHGARPQGRAGAGTDGARGRGASRAATGSSTSSRKARGVRSVGLEDKIPEPPTTDERRSILDLFRR